MITQRRVLDLGQPAPGWQLSLAGELRELTDGWRELDVHTLKVTFKSAGGPKTSLETSCRLAIPGVLLHKVDECTLVLRKDPDQALLAELQRRLAGLLLTKCTTFLGGQLDEGISGTASIALELGEDGTLHVSATLGLVVFGRPGNQVIVFVAFEGGIAALWVEVEVVDLALPRVTLVDGIMTADLFFPFDELKGEAPGLTAVLGQRVEYTLHADTPPGPPGLALRVGKRVDVAVVAGPPVDGSWALATLSGSATAGPVDLPLVNLQLQRLVLRLENGKLDLGQPSIIVVGTQFDGAGRNWAIGPIEVSVESVTPSLDWTEKKGLTLTLACEGVSLTVRDDPSVALTLDLTVAWSPAGFKVTKLGVTRPTHLDISWPDELPDLGDGSDRLAAILDRGAIELIRVLGGFAAAVGRAPTLGTNAASGPVRAFAAAASAALEEIATWTVAVEDKWGIEVRLGRRPLRIQQVLLTRLTVGGLSLKTGAVDVEVGPAWRPGVLIDLAGQPGAWVVLVGNPPRDSEVATIGIDLWLRREGLLEAVRDASGKTGGRPEERLFSVTANWVGAAGPQILALVGLQGGRARFLRRVVGRIQEIIKRDELSVVSAAGPIQLGAIGNDVKVTCSVASGRVLPFLGMGETGSPGDFLDQLKEMLGGALWIKKAEAKVNTSGDPEIEATLTLGLSVAGFESEFDLDIKLDLTTLETKFTVEKTIPIRGARVEKEAVGLTWILEPNAHSTMFNLKFGKEGARLELTEDARMLLVYDKLASGRGLVFEVDEFAVGPGGLTLQAKVLPDPIRLSGLDVPFTFRSGSLSIVRGELVSATFTGDGALPPGLIGDACCSLTLTLGFVGGSFRVQACHVGFERIGDPIVCRAIRCTLTIRHLDADFVWDGDKPHFYFLVTGKIRFTPEAGEFASGLLQHLQGVEIDLEKTPLCGDPRVIASHIRFQKEIKPPKTVNLFNLFELDLRGFGFHPSSPRFEGKPAVNFSGQIRFAEIGDLAAPEIDFHGLWIAPPKAGQSLPRIRADGLGVRLNLSGGLKVRGEVIAVDPDNPVVVEGGDLAPDGYKVAGFLGRGELDIPGWGVLALNLGFLEVSKEDGTHRRKAFYLYGQLGKIDVEIQTPYWTFHLREFGIGFGYRYTLEALRAADTAQSPAQLVKVLDDVGRRAADLSNIGAWRPEPTGNRFTLAMKAVMQAYPPPSREWDEAAEVEAENPFLFDLVAAIRTDLTLFMALRGWLGANYADYLADREGMRSKPGLRGYLYVSVPKKQLLARMIADSQGFIGTRIAALQGGETPLRKALRSVDWTATLFIKPGLFHYELGWPDQLSARLADTDRVKLNVRGGMIFRAAEDGLLWAYNVTADASLSFEGSLTAGPLSLTASASLSIRLVARVLSYLSWRFRDSFLYGLLSFDAVLSLRVSATLKLHRRLPAIRGSISGSFLVSAAAELVLSPDGLGARIRARVGVSVVGRTIGIDLHCTLNDARLDAARARVQRFLDMPITSEIPSDGPLRESIRRDRRMDGEAIRQVRAPFAGGAELVQLTKGADYWLVIRPASRPPPGIVVDGDSAYGMLVPMESETSDKAGFWPPPAKVQEYEVSVGPVAVVWRWVKKEGVKQEGWQEQDSSAFTVRPNLLVDWQADAPEDERVRLQEVLDQCFLPDGLEEDALRTTEPRPRTPDFKPLRTPDEERAAPTDEARAAARADAQREQRADAAAYAPHDEVHDARATVLATFSEQFDDFARTATRPPAGAHALDMGMVFFGRIADLEHLARRTVTVSGCESGSIRLLHPSNEWFDRSPSQEPFGEASFTVQGVKIPRRPRSESEKAQPPPLLAWYEVHRTAGLETGGAGSAPTFRVRPTTLIGGSKVEDGVRRVAHYQTDCEIVDDLADLPIEARVALGMCGDDPGAAVAAWQSYWSTAPWLTYHVVPVDVAGTRGQGWGYSLRVPEPEAPVVPATAELRFFVRDLAMGRRDCPTGDLGVAILVRDSTREGTRRALPPGVSLTRHYELVVAHEKLRPSGHYGTDGVTDRSLSRLATPFQPTGTRFALDGALRVLDERSAPHLEPRDEDLSVRWWGLVAGKTWITELDLEPPVLLPAQKRQEFLDALWARDGARVASRFALETVETWTFGKGDSAQRVVRRSALVPAGIWVRIEPVRPIKDSKITPTTLRPDMFEWPVDLPFPAHDSTQLRATTGLAAVRFPTGGFSSDPKYTRKPDPQRRSMTRLELGASPNVSDIHPIHHATVAGYDVFELDHDEMLPDDEPSDPGTWLRARRVARVERVTPEHAALLPEHNREWTGWEAHYPSRVPKDPTPPGKPPEEQYPTLLFAARNPPLRLLATVPEHLVDELLSRGRPAKLRMRLVAPDGGGSSTVDPELLAKCRPVLWNLCGLSRSGDLCRERGPDGLVVYRRGTLEAPAPLLDASTIREALLRFGWVPVCDVSRGFRTNPSFLEAVRLEVEALVEGTDKPLLTRVTSALVWSPHRHPWLEEVLGELEYAHDGGTVTTYRRYTVLPQPVPAVAHQGMEAFLEGTLGAADPYGWSALHTLGLSVAIRVYDGDTDDDLVGVARQALLYDVVVAAARRHRCVYGQAALGEPFVELLLKPGADRDLVDFELARGGGAEEADERIDPDDMLALVQLSLRPAAYAPVAPKRDAGDDPKPKPWWQGEPDDARFQVGVYSFWQNLRSALLDRAPEVPNAETFEAYKMLGLLYDRWSERFLVHRDAEPANCDKGRVSWALAAPTKLNPLHLASDSHGRITVLFADKDRWGHTRLYAVRPTGRYQHLAVATGRYDASGYDALGDSESLKGAGPIGYALAVVPRTERVPAPVVLGVEALPSDSPSAEGTTPARWSMVIARHDEVSLAASNTTLRGRLQHASLNVALHLQARAPGWPRRLKPDDNDVVIYPERTSAQYPESIADNHQGMADRIRSAEKAFGVMCKGAEIFDFEAPPPQHRVVGLVEVRGGLVGSEVVKVVHDRAARRRKVPWPKDRPPTLEIDELGALVVRLPWLVAYQDLSLAGPEWNKPEPNDLAWWPDPDIVYSLRYRAHTGDDVVFDDEVATIHLLASGTTLDPDRPPVMVRTRGPHLQHVGGPLSVDREEAGNRRYFRLSFKLSAPVATTEIARFPDEHPERWAALNDALAGCAELRVEHGIRVEFLEFPPEGDNWRDQVGDWRDGVDTGLRERADRILKRPTGSRAEASSQVELAKAIVQIAERFRSQRAPGVDEPHGDCRLRLTARIESSFHLLAALDAQEPPPEEKRSFRLTLTPGLATLNSLRLPTAFVAEAVDACGHPLGKKGPLWSHWRKLVLRGADSLVVRAMDERAAPHEDRDSLSAARVDLPTWVKP